MQLLVEKTLEYQRTVDPPAELVFTELATQYEALIDSAMALAQESNNGAGNITSQSQQPKMLQDKNKEIKRLKDQLKSLQAGNKEAENKVLRQKVKELEQENRQLRTRLSSNAKGASSTTPGGKAPVSAQRTRPRTSTVGGTKGNAGNNAPIGRTQNRILTLKQLKDTI